VALTAGIVVFLIACNGESWLSDERFSLMVFVTIVLSAAISSAIAAGLLPLNKLPKESGLPLAGKTGGRTGLLTAFLAAGMLVMGIHLKGYASGLYVSLPALLSVLPGALAGIFSAALIASSIEEPKEPATNKSLLEQSGGSGWTLGVFLLGLFGFVSPLIFTSGVWKDPPPIVEPVQPPPAAASAVSSPQDASPEAIRAPSPPVPPPPPFEFKPDPELAKARPECWEMATVKPLHSVEAGNNALAIMSPDGRLLAFLTSGSEGKEVALLNLLSLEQKKTWRFSTPVRRMAFSSDGKRLLFLTSGWRQELSVAQEDHALIELPVIEPLPVFDGAMEWPKEAEAVFHRIGKPALVLNMESLLIEEDASRTFTAKLAEGTTWRFAVNTIRESAVTPPPSGAVARWSVKQDLCLAVAHPTESISRLFPFIEVREGEHLLVAPDGNILVRLGGNGAQAYYFTRREPSPIDYEVSMPHEPEKFPEGSPLREAAARTGLRVMIYLPLINPLTRKCIGPDRSKILGRARVVSWEGTKARLRLSDIVGTPAVDSVFADPHTETEGALELTGLMVPHRWWAIAGDAKKDLPPPPEESNKSDIGLSLKYDRGSFAVGKLPEQKQTVAPLSDFPPLPPVTERDPDKQRVREFIMDHHVKAGRGDWGAVCADYASLVNYFDLGVVQWPMVVAAQRDYHMKHKVTEAVLEPLEITKLPDGRYDVRYELQSDIVTEGKAPSQKKSPVRLILQDEPSKGLRITSHNPKR